MCIIPLSRHFPAGRGTSACVSSILQPLTVSFQDCPVFILRRKKQKTFPPKNVAIMWLLMENGSISDYSGVSHKKKGFNKYVVLKKP